MKILKALERVCLGLAALVAISSLWAFIFAFFGFFWLFIFKGYRLI